MGLPNRGGSTPGKVHLSTTKSSRAPGTGTPIEGAGQKVHQSTPEYNNYIKQARSARISLITQWEISKINKIDMTYQIKERSSTYFTWTFVITTVCDCVHVRYRYLIILSLTL